MVNRYCFLANFYCEFSLNSKMFHGTCYIVKHLKLNLLGIDWIEQLDLWNIPLNSVCSTDLRDVQAETPFDSDVSGILSKSNVSISSKAGSVRNDLLRNLQEEFRQIFEAGLGRCCKMQANLYLKVGSKPVFRPKRPVPYSVLSQVEVELDRLEKTWDNKSGKLLIMGYASSGGEEDKRLHTFMW